MHHHHNHIDAIDEYFRDAVVVDFDVLHLFVMMMMMMMKMVLLLLLSVHSIIAASPYSWGITIFVVSILIIIIIIIISVIIGGSIRIDIRIIFIIVIDFLRFLVFECIATTIVAITDSFGEVLTLIMY
jgi:hypothetical protein